MSPDRAGRDPYTDPTRPTAEDWVAVPLPGTPDPVVPQAEMEPEDDPIVYEDEGPLKPLKGRIIYTPSLALHSRLKSLALRDGRSMTSLVDILVNQALKTYVPRNVSE